MSEPNPPLPPPNSPTPPGIDGPARTGRGTGNQRHRTPRRNRARRRAERHRINREHRRARRLRVGWDLTSRGAELTGGSRRRRTRRPTTTTEVLGVAAVAAASAWLLHLQGVRPPGQGELDLVTASLVAVAVAVVGAVIDRYVLVAWGFAALVVTSGRRFQRGVSFDTFAGSGWPLLAGLAAVALASGVALITRRGHTAFAPVIGTLSASLSLQCLASTAPRDWPTIGVILAVATALGVLGAVVLRVRPAWLFD